MTTPTFHSFFVTLDRRLADWSVVLEQERATVAATGCPEAAWRVEWLLRNKPSTQPLKPIGFRTEEQKREELYDNTWTDPRSPWVSWDRNSTQALNGVAV